ncbi:cationic amino acid transporter 4-like [Macrosteles quadrilineatus]|uniref:cationic amino acid transporter 4-like n=1 Tax=Macrosteles quadrilineatus TaxID=74068 RepID=UPI0023E27440|nr:cationic amino acid transporter 4-like [Macrosteles quadrilineatus]XP_054288766.1 cationic amino acid transporter 4-like [Macrosteles quadrilineatus]
MPGARHKILGHVFSGFCTKMNRTKQLSSADDNMETPLKRCLNTFDITLLGIGHMVGAGIYVLTGTVARDLAGPGIILSFILAGMTSMLAALCYAEFGTRVPKAGSAYIYTYVSVGEFWAFVIGWNIILEHMIGAASVARAWSGYIDSILGGVISNYTIETVGELHEQLLGRYPDFLAFAVCISYTCILAIGVKGSALVNSLLTLVNLAVMTLVIAVGFTYANIDNWTLDQKGFLPYGFSGVVAGAATCFYAFVGFDSIATSGEEARDPAFSIPIATITSMTLVCIGYILVGAALTLMVPYDQISPTAALPEAFTTLNLPWVRYAVTLGALCGMTTTLLGSLFALPRCMYAMAADGLIFSFLGKVNKTTQVPIINLAVSGISSALIALFFDLEKLVEFMSIGTLLAYTIVSASVIILRYRPEVTPLLREDSSLSEVGTPSSGVIEFGVGPAGRLRTGYSWLEPVVGRCEPGAAVSACVFIFSCFCAALCLHLHWTNQQQQLNSWWTVLITVFFIFVLVACIVIIHAHEQNKNGLGFAVPLVPLIPAISILSNIQLMVHLNTLTWLRFMIWMAFGLLVYFLYGIHHSKENDTATSYSVLLGSGEAGKIRWGSIGAAKRRSVAEDTKPIVDEEELPQ